MNDGRRQSICVSAYMRANVRHMFAFEDWWAASKDRFEWKPVEAALKLQATMDVLAAGMLLPDGDIWMLGCRDRSGWARQTDGASWPIGNQQPTGSAEPDLESSMMRWARGRCRTIFHVRHRRLAAVLITVRQEKKGPTESLKARSPV